MAAVVGAGGGMWLPSSARERGVAAVVGAGAGSGCRRRRGSGEWLPSSARERGVAAVVGAGAAAGPEPGASAVVGR
ncbi:hypothetical protein ACFU8Q_13315 [Streptomyces sp. NPDC057543]|uniref:hypothetical protein n=1 Tax=Streptomyces sp. NPDC057543 TaxID=3346163 RepID=UPI0036ADAF3D